MAKRNNNQLAVLDKLAEDWTRIEPMDGDSTKRLADYFLKKLDKYNGNV